MGSDCISSWSLLIFLLCCRIVTCEFVACTKQTRSSLLQTCLVGVCGSHKTNKIYFAADLFMCEFVARTKQTRSTLLQTCLCVSLWLVQKQTRSTLLQICLCVSLWLVQNKPDLLCYKLVYVWVCGSYKTNQIYFAADLFMCEFCGSYKTNQIYFAADLFMCEFCGSHKTNKIYFAADLFMCEFVARTKQTRSTLLQTCLCVSLWLAQNKPDVLCCRLVYVWVCGSYKTNKIYFAADLFMCEFVARTK